MSSDDHWITTRIIEAQKDHPLVTGGVLVRIDRFLKGELSARKLPSRELASVAKALIADMISPPPNSDAKQ